MSSLSLCMPPASFFKGSRRLLIRAYIHSLRRDFRILSLACFLLPAGVCWSDAEKRASVVSAERHFVVSGPTAEDSLVVGLWAEDVWRQVEHFVGTPVYFAAGEPLRIQLEYADQSSPRPFIQANTWADQFALTQYLVLRDVSRSDHSDATIALTRLLLTRYVYQCANPLRWDVIDATLPDWLCIGAGVWVNPNQQAAQREELLEALQAGCQISLCRFLDEPTTFIGRAAAGEFMRWAMSLEDQPERTQAYLCQRNAVLDEPPQQVACSFFGFPSLDAAERSFGLWLASQSRLRGISIGCTMDDIDALRRVLIIPRELMSIHAGYEVVNDMPLADLRNQESTWWMQGLYEAIKARIATVVIGRSPELQDAALHYIRYVRLCSQSDVPVEELENAWHAAQQNLNDVTERVLLDVF